MPDVHIHIGRVELTAVTAPPPRRERAPAPNNRMSLDEIPAPTQWGRTVSNALAFAGVTAVLKDLLDTGMIDHEVTDTSQDRASPCPRWRPDAIQLGNEMGARPEPVHAPGHANAAWRNTAQPSRDTTGRHCQFAALAVDLHSPADRVFERRPAGRGAAQYAMQLFHETPHWRVAPSAPR